MATDQLGLLVQRAMTDAEFRRRAQADLDGTLAAEGYRLSSEEMEAVRSFQQEVAGLPPDQVDARLASAARRQGF